MEKHGKHGSIFSGHISRAWISMETMGHRLLVILNSMESMGSMVHYFLMISDSMEKHGKQGIAFLVISNSMGSMGTPFFHELR